MHETIERQIVLDSVQDLQDCCREQAFKMDFNAEGQQTRCTCGNHLKTVLLEVAANEADWTTGSLSLVQRAGRLFGKTKLQTLELSKKRFQNLKAAEAWVANHGFHDYKTEATINFFRFRQMPPSWFAKETFRTIRVSDGVLGVVGVVKPEHKGKTPTREQIVAGELAPLAPEPAPAAETAKDIGTSTTQFASAVLRVQGILDVQEGHQHRVWLFLDRETGAFDGETAEVQGHRHRVEGQVAMEGLKITSLKVYADVSEATKVSHEHGTSSLRLVAGRPAGNGD